MRRVLVLALAITVALVAWFLRGSHDSSTAAQPVTVVPPATEETPLPNAPSVTEPDVPPPSPAPATAVAEVAAEPTLESNTPKAESVLVYGFVKPPEGRESFAQQPKLWLIDSRAERVSAEAGEDGAYSIPGLRPGRYWLGAYSSLDGEAKRVLELDSSQDELRIDLQLAPQPQVRVKVVDAVGEPIRAPLLAVATLEAPGEWFDEVFGSWNNPFGVGHFWQNGFASERLPDQYLGVVKLDIEAPVFVSVLHYQRVVATQKVDKGQDEVVFVLDPGSPLLQPGRLSFRFVDAQTRDPLPVAGAMVDSWGSRMLTGTDGRFALEKMEPGACEISAQHPGYERLLLRVRIEPGIDNDLGDIPLDREQWISGTIVDENGSPLGATIGIERYDTQTRTAQRSMVGRSFKSGTDGRFRIGGLSRDVYALRDRSGDSPWARFVVIIDTRTGPVEDVQLVLRKGVPLILSASDPQEATARYRILDEKGLTVLSPRLRSGTPQKFLLAPGEYELEVRANESAEPRRVPVTIGNEPVELALP